MELKITGMKDDLTRQKVMGTALYVIGIDYIAADLKEEKLTVIGKMDPKAVEMKLKKTKTWKVEILSLDPA